jgi:hypothetical protein
MTSEAGGDRYEAAMRRAVRALNHSPRRPLPPAVAWRWRYEIALAVAVPVVVIFLLAIMGWRWTIADIVILGIFLAVCPPVRLAIIARARCIVTAHRVRTGCAEAYLVSRRGALPLIYSTVPTLSGEQVRLWCPAGIVAADFEAVTELLAAACWAREVRIIRDPEHPHLVTVDVIRYQVTA